MPYCGREHQVAHRNEHKRACNAIKKSKEKLDAEEVKLRNMPPDMFTPANLFEEQVGRFWGILDTRDYMRARYAYADALLKIESTLAVQAAFDNIRDLLRLCRGDNMGMRYVLPGIFLRLGRDQECYDFIKWWAIDRPDYDWSDMSLPYLDMKDEDVFGGVALFTKEYSNLCFTVAITLIKIRLLLDLENLQNASILCAKMPQELLDGVRSQLVSDAIVHNPRKKDLMEGKNLTSLIKELKSQIDDLHTAVYESNPYFWPAMLDPQRHLTAEPQPYSAGSIPEMQIYLQYSYASWAETSGAIEIIEKLEEGTFFTDEELGEQGE
ncbi:hypothetical protein EG329_008653 [Mollisiaceae sp. DMI_Dod_QoI]|nr:hypothetical protein EG329_008653 [Helotiales sp. DMI_Dod_QoI]